MFLDSLFGGGSANPADAAKPYLDKIPSEIKPFYDPYITQGKESMGQFSGQIDNLLTNPTALIDRLGAHYKQSPGFQNTYQSAMRGINQAASAGGMLGTPAHQYDAATAAGAVANQDYDNYLTRALGLYDRGLSGANSLTNLGYQASDTNARQIADALQSQAQLAYTGQQNENQADQGMFGTALGIASGFF